MQNYPRGEKELLGPFHQFMTGDTIDWFEKRGVELKIEEDGRMFPVSNSSQTIIDCFLKEAKKHQVDILYNHSVKSIHNQNDLWQIETSQELFSCEKVLIATGSNHQNMESFRNIRAYHFTTCSIIFTFNIKDERIKDIPGVVAQNVEVQVVDSESVFMKGLY